VTCPRVSQTVNARVEGLDLVQYFLYELLTITTIDALLLLAYYVPVLPAFIIFLQIFYILHLPSYICTYSSVLGLCIIISVMLVISIFAICTIVIG